MITDIKPVVRYPSQEKLLGDEHFPIRKIDQHPAWSNGAFLDCSAPPEQFSKAVENHPHSTPNLVKFKEILNIWEFEMTPATPVAQLRKQCNKKKYSLIAFLVSNTPVLMNRVYFTYFLKKYGNVEFYYSDKHKAFILKKDGKFIGVVKPMFWELSLEENIAIMQR